MSFTHDTTPIARKRYRCWFCDQRIEKGEKHGHRAGSDGGDFFSMRFHFECQQQADDDRWTQDDYECHEPGDFVRPMTAFDPSI